MDKIVKIALMVLSHRNSGGESGAARITAGALCTGAAIISMTVGIACLLAALWIYLIPIVGSAEAALIVGAVLLVSSGILMLIAHRQFTPAEYDPKAPRESALGEDLMEDLRETFEDNKLLTLMAALVAGLVLGNKK